MNTLAQHFRENEKNFVNKAIAWSEQVDAQYTPYLTSFLNPRERYILKTVSSYYQLGYQSYSHFTNAERKRVIIFPDYYTPSLEDFELQVLDIKYSKKFNHLKHSQVLGSLIGSGIKREQLGDIVSENGNFQIETAHALTDYFVQQVTKMGRVPVQLIKNETGPFLSMKSDYQVEKTTISSFRLDNIVSTVYNIPRQRAKEWIQKSHVKVNHSIVEQPDFQVSESDLISVEKYGRIRLEYIDDIRTKKGKYRIQYGILKNKK